MTSKIWKVVRTFFIEEDKNDFESSINYQMIQDGYAKVCQLLQNIIIVYNI